MATNAAMQYILPATQIAASERPAVAALTVVAGHAGAGFVAAAMALSIFVALNGTVMSGARIPFAAARDRLFFRQFAHISPRFQSPSTSLVIQGAAGHSSVAVLQPVSSSSLIWPSLPSGSSTCSPPPPSSSTAAAGLICARPYQVWGYPLLPAIFCVCAAAVLVCSYLGNLEGSLLGAALILLGLPVLWLVRRQYGPSVPIEESHCE